MSTPAQNVRAITEATWAENEAMIKRTVKASVDQFIEDLPKKLHSVIESASFSLLGLEKDSWNGKWKWDNCNGRTGYLQQTVEHHAKHAVADAAPQIYSEAMRIIMDREAEIRSLCIKTYIDEYKEHLTKVMKDNARSDASRAATSIVNNMIGKIVTDRLDKPFDIDEPVDESDKARMANLEMRVQQENISM
jgi:hypothetical protein